MVKNTEQIFKPFFHKIEPAKTKVIRSVGLFYIYLFLRKEGFQNYLQKRLKDKRVRLKVKYPIWELIISIILHILDGDKRLHHYNRNPNSELFKKLFNQKSMPGSSTILKSLKRNPHLGRILESILFRISLLKIIDYCQANNNKRITIDVDQTAREIHGKQAGVSSGYSAGKRNAKLYQIRIYTIRELKLTLKVRLLHGSAHSSFSFEKEIRFISKILEKVGITGLFVGDSGFISGAVCNYLEESRHYFVFAEKQRKDVKRRGKYAKMKRFNRTGTVEIKEGRKQITSRYKYQFREIYVRVHSPDGQLWFDFASDQFTNVFVTNMKCKAERIYRIYKEHAVIETIIEELKNDFGAGLAHCNNFEVNSAMTACCAIAYNLKNQFLVKTGIKLKENEKIKLSTFQSLWLHTPGIIVKNENRSILRIAAERFKLFQKIKVA
ncbi:MAG: transposase [Vicingaceae bacterium]|nr:transposase [Vicingaceae bacterium]